MTMLEASESPTMHFDVSGSTNAISIKVQRLVIAGYTGRDRIVVQEHIDELAAMGVPPPPRVPMFFDIPPALLTSEDSIHVAGESTSGEVEPVLVRDATALYLAVGSDHTDREEEKRDIASSKASCPKPISRTVILMEDLEATWDHITVSCQVDGQVYQHGRLNALLPPRRLIDELTSMGSRLDAGTVLFCGTLPLVNSRFVFGTQYALKLELPDGPAVSHSYQVAISRS